MNSNNVQGFAQSLPIIKKGCNGTYYLEADLLLRVTNASMGQVVGGDILDEFSTITIRVNTEVAIALAKGLYEISELLEQEEKLLKEHGLHVHSHAEPIVPTRNPPEKLENVNDTGNAAADSTNPTPDQSQSEKVSQSQSPEEGSQPTASSD